MLAPPGYTHPARVAERIATLDLISSGRVDWGTGESASRVELEGFGIDPEQKKAMWIFQAGQLDEEANEIRASVLPSGAMTLTELFQKVKGKSPSGPAFDAYKALLAVDTSYSLALFLPPGTSDDIKQAYWSGCEALVKDPEFRKTTNTMMGGEARWSAGESAEKGFKKVFTVAPDTVKWLRDILSTRYNVALKMD